MRPFLCLLLFAAAALSKQAQTCSQQGQACALPSDCCTGLNCTNNTCLDEFTVQCANVTQTCTTTADCCQNTSPLLSCNQFEQPARCQQCEPTNGACLFGHDDMCCNGSAPSQTSYCHFVVGNNSFCEPCPSAGQPCGTSAAKCCQPGSFCNSSTICQATAAPTTAPTPAPTNAPTAAPTKAPTRAPTNAPTAAPTIAPTAAPTTAPTKAPTKAPTTAPTVAPTRTPTVAPTAVPLGTPTEAPTPPTVAPTQAPTATPTAEPTQAPTQAPTATPTATPTRAPTAAPTAAPTEEPTEAPTTASPTGAPTASPTVAPTAEPLCPGSVTYFTRVMRQRGTDPEFVLVGTASNPQETINGWFVTTTQITAEAGDVFKLQWFADCYSVILEPAGVDLGLLGVPDQGVQPLSAYAIVSSV